MGNKDREGDCRALPPPFQRNNVYEFVCMKQGEELREGGLYGV